MTLGQLLSFFEPLSSVRGRFYRMKKKKKTNRDFVKVSCDTYKTPSKVPGTEQG